MQDVEEQGGGGGQPARLMVPLRRMRAKTTPPDLVRPGFRKGDEVECLQAFMTSCQAGWRIRVDPGDLGVVKRFSDETGSAFVVFSKDAKCKHWVAREDFCKLKQCLLEV